MQPLATLALRTADFELTGAGSRSLRRLAETGVMRRVVRGAYVRADQWRALSERQKYAATIHATVSRLSSPVVISHWSAAAVWGFPVPSQWPVDVQVIDSRRSTNNRIATLHRRPGEFRDGDTVLWEGLWVTSAARTAADLALLAPYDEAVMLLDYGLHFGLFDRELVAEHLARRPQARRAKAAAAALAFATPAAEWPGESFSRVHMALRGFEPPELQRPFRDQKGLIGYADFSWVGCRCVGEFDGDWKYTDERFLRGRSVAQVVRDEKERQQRLEALHDVERVLRWGYAVARDPDELSRRLLAGGVPRIGARRRTVV